MTVDRLVFIPFKRDQAGDFIAETKKAEALGASTHHGRKFALVCYDDPGKPLASLGFSPMTRVMIAGHGLAGRPYISNSAGYGQKEYLPYNVVVDRLIEKGLPKRYLGAISCDVCYSSIKNDNNPAFADLVARYLHKKGYRLAHTIGYLGPLGAVPEKISDKHKFLHRVVDLMKDGVEVTVKSTDAKERFLGARSIPRHLENLAAVANTCPAY